MTVKYINSRQPLRSTSCRPRTATAIVGTSTISEKIVSNATACCAATGLSGDRMTLR
jgi:hypothetical protein